jgi:hypothetical protein
MDLGGLQMELKALYEHLQVEAKRGILRSVLVGERYFANEASEALIRQDFVNREAFIYSERLLENPRNLEEEYLPVREQGFRRAVVTALRWHQANVLRTQ